MKKLFLLLFAILSFVSSANTVTYDYSYSGDSLNGSDGSSCYVNKYGYGDSIVCDNGSGAEGVLGYTSAPMYLGYQSGEAAGNIINAIADAMIQGMKNEQATKANTYVPPALNNSLRKTPFYNFDTTYKADGVNFSGSDGIRCSFYSENEMNCNNGVNYYLSSPTKMRGSDGTAYVSDWKNDTDNNYYCVTSSFGSKCCGNRTSKTCSSNNNIPDNAYATSSGWRCNNGYLKISDKCKKVTNQSNYTNKEPEKSKTNNQKSSSAPKESSKSTSQFNFGSLSLSEFYQFLGGLLFLGFILWMIFSDLIKSIYNRFFNND